MREQVDRLQKLTTDLLDLSRLDAGSIDLELEPVPLQDAGEPGGRRVRRGGRAQGLRDRGHRSRLPTRHRGGLRPGAGGPDRPRADRQRARPHSRRDAHHGRRAARRSDRRPGHRAVARQRRRARDQAPGPDGGLRTLPHERLRVRARGSGSRSPASWRNACAAASRSSRSPATPSSRSRFRWRASGRAPRDAGPPMHRHRMPRSERDRAGVRAAGIARADRRTHRRLWRRRGRRRRRPSSAPACRWSKASAGKNGFDPTTIYERLSPGVVTITSLFSEGESLADVLGGGGGGPGQRLRARRRGLHRHQRARDHQRDAAAS